MEERFFKNCYHHANRRAVVRCPECGWFFCRECVTEHGNRMLCSGCLKSHLDSIDQKSPGRLYPLIIFAQCSIGFLILWYGFFLLGRFLLAIPHSFHEGTFWQSGWWLN